MAEFSFELGVNHAGLANIEDMSPPIQAPDDTFVEYSQSLDLGDGTVRGAGWTWASWFWKGMSQASRDVLKAFCTGKSANVSIVTKKGDGTYQEYTAVMVWPEEEGRALDLILNLEIVFRKMVEV